ncbi:hypothetical protein MWU60_07610 [Yoonia sp. F2084L]|uniref:hypothetical protein n=1 Tax=Yoonia sp. F2084L TaxID=2926419 RepID=UPI001FF4137F|nr:hypothetical protein [Yoonia sp. F2084L]MCK0095434.1 hypothetical protein [Yoonia sp. F2084L]
MFSADCSQDALENTADRSVTNQGEVRSNAVVAVFRDQETADAVTSSPPIVRLFLEEAGFGLTPATIENAEDYVPPADMSMRRTLVEQVTLALSNRALKKALARAAKDSEFDVAAFIAAVVSKEPSDAASKSEEFKRKSPVMPRRPYQLRGKGIKSRMRPC